MPETSSLRRDQAISVRQRILAAGLEVVESGGEPNMRAVASAAAISERTVYRYFGSRDELFAALVPELRARVSAPMAEDISGLEVYVRRLFTQFDRNAALARALAKAAWAPTGMTRPANLRALRAIIDAAFPTVPAADRESASAALRVPMSAVGWAYLADCGLELEASIAHVQWLVRAVLEKLQEQSGGNHA